MKTEIVNPLWLRLWHAMQALLFLILMLTGLSMHLARTFWAWIPAAKAGASPSSATLSSSVEGDSATA